MLCVPQYIHALHKYLRISNILNLFCVVYVTGSGRFSSQAEVIGYWEKCRSSVSLPVLEVFLKTVERICRKFLDKMWVPGM